MQVKRKKLDFIPSIASHPIFLIFLAIIFCSALSFKQALICSTLITSNQEKQSQKSPNDLTISAQELTEKYIRPVIAGLKNRRANDKKFVDHLENIKPFIDTKVTRYPNVWAYDGRDKSFVQIDLVFLLEAFGVAELGATSLIFSNIDDKLFERLTIEYLSECVLSFQQFF